MILIGKNDAFLNYLSSNKLYIISSVLYKIDIFEEQHTPSIELYFKLSRNNQLLKVKFTNILKYCFYYNNDRSFYNIERCKFFKKNDVFYISIDPYDEGENINENDQDFILCKEILGFIE